MAKFITGQITISKLQQQNIKTLQYLQLKSPFLRDDLSFHFISMQMASTIIHNYKAHTATHIEKMFIYRSTSNISLLVTQKWQQTQNTVTT